MKHSQVVTRSTLTAIALLNLSLATSALAEPLVVTRGPNGAAYVVNSDHIPVDAQLPPNSEAHKFPELTRKGPGGASHLVRDAESPEMMKNVQSSRLIQRGSHSAYSISFQ